MADDDPQCFEAMYVTQMTNCGCFTLLPNFLKLLRGDNHQHSDKIWPRVNTRVGELRLEDWPLRPQLPLRREGSLMSLL